MQQVTDLGTSFGFTLLPSLSLKCICELSDDFCVTNCTGIFNSCMEVPVQSLLPGRML